MAIDHKSLDNEERIKQLLEQAQDENHEEYRQRLVERSTGTRDPGRQRERLEIINMMNSLKNRLAALDAKRDEQFIDQISRGLMEIVNALPDEPNLRFSTYAQPMNTRGRAY